MSAVPISKRFSSVYALPREAKIHKCQHSSELLSILTPFIPEAWFEVLQGPFITVDINWLDNQQYDMQETFVWRDFLVFRAWPPSTLFPGISLLPEVDYITVYNVLLGSRMENLCLMPATDFPFWASFVNRLLRSMTNIKEADITRHVGVPGNVIEYFTLIRLFVLNVLWEDKGEFKRCYVPICFGTWVTECAVLRCSKVFSIEWKQHWSEEPTERQSCIRIHISGWYDGHR